LAVRRARQDLVDELGCGLVHPPAGARRTQPARGDFYQYHRFLVPILPLLLCALVATGVLKR
jgi:hypothetical protein